MRNAVSPRKRPKRALGQPSIKPRKVEKRAVLAGARKPTRVRQSGADKKADARLRRNGKSKLAPPLPNTGKSQLRIGISGWTYPPWRGVFYPAGWTQKRELEFASRQVNSIEINGSFYSLQSPKSYRTWYEATPPDFLFSVKGSRFITHLKRLKDVDAPLANFFASGVLHLREKLGPFLWQLPPHLPYDPQRLEAFFQLLPRTGSDAATLARRHDDRVKDRVWTKADGIHQIRHALEVRHPSFVSAHFIELLRANKIALVVADTAGKWPFMEDVTADFVYVRLHGDEELYVSGYTDQALDSWARKIRTWSNGGTPRSAHRLSSAFHIEQRDIFVYFDNDAKVHAPFDAMSLAHRLGISEDPGTPPDLTNAGEPARTNWPSPRNWRGVRQK
jgi:uncharacterized protein YecE (DUF72 family)